jgi:hypothetical protein
VPGTTFEDVKAFALQELWQPSCALNADTALAQDFGIAGLDGRDFMEAYSRHFGVDLEGFDWVEYFGPEGVSPLWPVGALKYLWCRVRGLSARDLVRLPELTLGHLVDCANAGKWRAPDGTPSNVGD